MSRYYAVYDSESKSFHPPFVSRSDADAARMITMSSQDPKTGLAMFANDYTLFFVGEFDEKKGFIIPAKPTQVAKVAALLKNKTEVKNDKVQNS